MAGVDEQTKSTPSDAAEPTTRQETLLSGLHAKLYVVEATAMPSGMRADGSAYAADDAFLATTILWVKFGGSRSVGKRLNPHARMTCMPLHLGPRARIIRDLAEGAAAASAGEPATTNPYTVAVHPLTRAAWFVGYSRRLAALHPSRRPSAQSEQLDPRPPMPDPYPTDPRPDRPAKPSDRFIGRVEDLIV